MATRPRDGWTIEPIILHQQAASLSPRLVCQVWTPRWKKMKKISDMRTNSGDRVTFPNGIASGRVDRPTSLRANCSGLSRIDTEQSTWKHELFKRLSDCFPTVLNVDWIGIIGKDWRPSPQLTCRTAHLTREIEALPENFSSNCSKKLGIIFSPTIFRRTEQFSGVSLPLALFQITLLTWSAQVIQRLVLAKHFRNKLSGDTFETILTCADGPWATVVKLLVKWDDGEPKKVSKATWAPFLNAGVYFRFFCSRKWWIAKLQEVEFLLGEGRKCVNSWRGLHPRTRVSLFNNTTREL